MELSPPDKEKVLKELIAQFARGKYQATLLAEVWTEAGNPALAKQCADEAVEKQKAIDILEKKMGGEE